MIQNSSVSNTQKITENQNGFIDNRKMQNNGLQSRNSNNANVAYGQQGAPSQNNNVPPQVPELRDLNK
jgi:hypothetical protein